MTAEYKIDPVQFGKHIAAIEANTVAVAAVAKSLHEYIDANNTRVAKIESAYRHAKFFFLGLTLATLVAVYGWDGLAKLKLLVP